MNILFKSAVIGLSLMSLTACHTAFGGNTYHKDDLNRIADIQYGKVISVEHVKVQNDSTGVGALSGAAIGAAAGSTVGGGNDEKRAATAVGAVAGGMAGAKAEQHMRGQPAFRYTLQLDGETGYVTVVQADKAPLAQPGETVRVEMGHAIKILPNY